MNPLVDPAEYNCTFYGGPTGSNISLIDRCCGRYPAVQGSLDFESSCLVPKRSIFRSCLAEEGFVAECKELHPWAASSGARQSPTRNTLLCLLLLSLAMGSVRASASGSLASDSAAGKPTPASISAAIEESCGAHHCSRLATFISSTAREVDGTSPLAS